MSNFKIESVDEKSAYITIEYEHHCNCSDCCCGECMPNSYPYGDEGETEIFLSREDIKNIAQKMGMKVKDK